LVARFCFDWKVRDATRPLFLANGNSTQGRVVNFLELFFVTRDSASHLDYENFF